MIMHLGSRNNLFQKTMLDIKMTHITTNVNRFNETESDIFPEEKMRS